MINDVLIKKFGTIIDTSCLHQVNAPFQVFNENDPAIRDGYFFRRWLDKIYETHCLLLS